MAYDMLILIPEKVMDVKTSFFKTYLSDNKCNFDVCL